MHTARKLPNLAAIGWLVVAAAASAGPIEVLYSTIPGDPTNAIPGTPGLTFKNLWRPYRSPNGKYWGMRANSDFFDGGSLLLYGRNKSATALAYYGTTIPGGQPGEFVTNVDHQLGIRNDGRVAFGVNTSFGSGPEPSPDEYILLWDPLGGMSVYLRETDQIPGFAPGVTYGPLIGETHLLEDGTVCFNTINAIGLPTSQNVLYLRGGTVVAQEGVTVPLGQALGGTQPWQFFDFDGYWHSADGSHYLLQGDLAGATNRDNVVVVDNHVVIQEGQQIFPFVSAVAGDSSGLRAVYMAPGGDWFCRGGNSDGQDWVVRNGAVVAATHAPIYTGAVEQFDDAVPNTEGFFMQAGNDVGDYVVGGYTNNASLSLNSVVVLNRTSVVAREGDRVDLNGNCLADDDAFISVFQPDQACLTNGRGLYFNAELRNGAGVSLGKALLRICLGTTAGDLDCNGTVDADDAAELVRLLLGQTTDCATALRGDVNGDTRLDGTDVQAFVDVEIP
ncbi:MAG: dockerin type I repeat-containing protein [Phycisphaerae bacterium]